MNSFFSGLERLTDVNGSIVETNELEDVTHARREMLEGVRRDEDAAIDVGG